MDEVEFGLEFTPHRPTIPDLLDQWTCSAHYIRNTNIPLQNSKYTFTIVNESPSSMC